MRPCTHKRRKTGDPLPFLGTILGPDGENESAHGGCSYRETCLDCGSERNYNANGRHTELGYWHAGEEQSAS